MAGMKSAIDKLQSKVAQNTSSTSADLKIGLIFCGIAAIELDIFGNLLLDGGLNKILQNQTVFFPVINSLPILVPNASDSYQTSAIQMMNRVGQYQTSLSIPVNPAQNPAVDYAQRVYNSTYSGPVAAVNDLNNCLWCVVDHLDVLHLIATAYTFGGYQWPLMDVGIRSLIILASELSYGYEGYMKLDQNGTLLGLSYTDKKIFLINGTTTTPFFLADFLNQLSGSTGISP